MFFKKECSMMQKWLHRIAGIVLICAFVFLGACGNITINSDGNQDSGTTDGNDDNSGDNGITPPPSPPPPETVPVTGVMIDPVTLAVIEGQTLQLTFTISPDTATDKTLTWTSSDPTFASVSNTGLVTGVAAGSADITATSADGPGDTVTVTVVSVSVSLNTTETYIVVGDTEELAVAVSPSHADQAVTWSSDDESIATVDDTGLITAAGTGTATITVTSAADPSKTASCMVNVVDTGVTLTGLTLSPNPLALAKGGSGIPITVTYSPSGATERAITWDTSDPAVAVLSNGMVYAVGAGTAVITATSAVHPGISDTITVNVTVPVSWVSLDSTSLNLILGGAGGTLTAAVGPADAGNQSLTWETSDSTVVSLSGSGNSRTLTAHKVGTAVITVRSLDDLTKSKSCTVRVFEQGIEMINIVFTGIEDETITLNEPLLYPTQLVITATGGFDRYLWYADGEYLGTTTEPTATYDLPFSSLPPGTYYITVIVEDDGYHFSKTLAYTVGY
jgi:uncharacterized protein YjdB